MPAGSEAERLAARYREARYEVTTAEGPRAFRVGEASDALRRIHAAHQVDRSAFLTAWNPRSERHDAAANDRAQQQLVAALRLRGWRWLPAQGQDPLGHWPPEDSLLVLGIDVVESSALAREHGQNAILAIGPDAVPQLVWVQDQPPSASAAEAPAGSLPSGR